MLNKNLNFCPTRGDYKEGHERNKLKSFFELKNQDKPNKNNSTTLDITNIKSKST